MDSQPSIKPAIQRRSKDTQERILAATEKLLGQCRYEELSIAEIAKAARCGVGTVYGRFENKAALLQALEQRLVQSICDRQQEFLASRDWTKVGFDRRVRLLIDHVADGYQQQAGVFREVLGGIHVSAQGAQANSRSAITDVFQTSVKFLLEGLPPAQRKRLKKPLSLAYLSVITMLQNRIVHGASSPIESSFSLLYLRAELGRMLIAYVKAGK